MPLKRQRWVKDKDGETQQAEKLACRELHQRTRLSFRRRRYICGRNERKQQKVTSGCKPRRERPGEETGILFITGV